MGTASADAGEKSVFYNGKEYAALDFTPPNSNEDGGQTEFLKVPEGWALAETSEGVIEEVIAKFPWGAAVVVLGSGDGYWTSLRGHGHQAPGQLYVNFNGTCLEGRVTRHGPMRKPKHGGMRVLMCRAVACDLAADGDHCTQALTRMWESGKFADCEVVCNGHAFQCHRVVLAQASPVFNQMLSGEMLEAKSQRIQLEALESETEAASAFLEFVYTGRLDCKSEHFPTVVKLADFYQLDCITAKTCDNMLKALDADNAVPMARILKSMREKPHVKPYWEKLTDKVQRSKELAVAVLSQV